MALFRQDATLEFGQVWRILCFFFLGGGVWGFCIARVGWSDDSPNLDKPINHDRSLVSDSNSMLTDATSCFPNSTSHGPIDVSFVPVSPLNLAPIGSTQTSHKSYCQAPTA